ncbi:MAG: hypothetical protein ACP5D2_02430, partial [Candidatus Nanoarchaeia archaeon]
NIPVSKRGKVRAVLDVIEGLKEKFNTTLIPQEEVIKELVDSGMKNWEINDIVIQLKKDGLILEPRRGYFSLL